MSIEPSAEVDEKGRSVDPTSPVGGTENDAKRQDTEAVDWQGLTPASNAKAGEATKRAKDEMGDKVINEPDYPGLGENKGDTTEMPAAGNRVLPLTPERGLDINRSPKPDARDEEKVDRLQAADWRADQPMPSAKNAVDPRGENAPAELFEEPEDKKKK